MPINIGKGCAKWRTPFLSKKKMSVLIERLCRVDEIR
jgi:hypothetical protein